MNTVRSMYSENSSIWNKKEATLSEKNAIKEYGITKGEIIEAIKEGKLQYRLNYAHGNPYYKLVRNEVESLAKNKYGDSYFEEQKRKTELELVNKQLRKLRRQIKVLEIRKIELEPE
jgi:3'-phosphoadenosine 5'-phosphosulfate sulfotransferase